MGCGQEFICKTCKQTYNLGYGGYSTWIFANTLEEYDASDDGHKGMHKNQNLRACLEQHQGHDYEIISEDYTHTDGDDLWLDGGYDAGTLIVEGYKKFTFTDLAP